GIRAVTNPLPHLTNVLPSNGKALPYDLRENVRHRLPAVPTFKRERVRQVTGLRPQLKWPNDILMNYKKVGGILTETGVTGDHLDYVVVGIGLNVNLEVSRIPEISATATSLWQELGRKVPRLRLLQEILKRIEGRYQRLEAGESPHEEWASSLVTLRRRVRVTTPEGQEEGWAEGVDEDGALILRRGDGSTVLIAAGDVTLKTEMSSG
ncbi:MAG: biotin--[acetyl-CoA-carboxylase] ligase, partial [Anaerolineae bacterium]